MSWCQLHLLYLLLRRRLLRRLLRRLRRLLRRLHLLHLLHLLLLPVGTHSLDNAHEPLVFRPWEVTDGNLQGRIWHEALVAELGVGLGACIMST